MRFTGTLEEIDRILTTPPISMEEGRKYILAEYDKYARLMGHASYAALKEWAVFSNQPPAHSK